MKQTFTDEELTQALESLRAEATDERFQWLTQETEEANGAIPDDNMAGHTHRPSVAVRLRRWGVAAMLGVAVGVGITIWERFVAVTPSELERALEKPEQLAVAHEKTEGPTRQQLGAIGSNKDNEEVKSVRATEQPATISSATKTADAATASATDDLGQLLTQSATDMDEADRRREEMTDIVDRYTAFVEP